jgi:RNA polymerase sigma-70 factor (ECF subfamily)
MLPTRHIPPLDIVNPRLPDVRRGVPGVAGDDALVEHARRGDAEAFALLYYRYKLDVWNLAFFKLRDHHEAEDSVQETFLRAYRALGQYRRNDTVRPWLLTICRNVCLDRMRAGHRRRALSLDDGTLAEPASRVEDHEGRMDLHRALAGLPADELEAFFLVDVIGCRSEEASRILGLQASSTLRSRVARARRQVAAAVGEAPAQGIPEIWGVFHAPRANAIVVSFAALPGSVEARRHLRERGGCDLVGFFDGLDRAIPGDRTVVAIMDDRPARGMNATGRWLAEHPRWRLRRATTHASWLSEAATLLPCDDHRRMLGLLRTARPFAWTHSA